MDLSKDDLLVYICLRMIFSEGIIDYAFSVMFLYNVMGGRDV